MAEQSLTNEQVLGLLAAGPQRIAEMTAGLTPEQLRAAPSPGEWPAVELLAHLRACADVWGGYITRILAQDKPTFRAVSPRTWIKKTNYREQAFAPALRAFTEQRAGLLAVLEKLPPEAWLRVATVTRARKTLVRSVYDYAGGLAGHERVHLEQFEQIAAAVRQDG